MFLEERREKQVEGQREREKKVRDGAAEAGEDAVEGLERIARPRMVGIRWWEEGKGRNLGSAMVVGMERGLFTFPNDQLASSRRGRDLPPIGESLPM